MEQSSLQGRITILPADSGSNKQIRVILNIETVKLMALGVKH